MTSEATQMSLRAALILEDLHASGLSRAVDVYEVDGKLLIVPFDDISTCLPMLRKRGLRHEGGYIFQHGVVSLVIDRYRPES
jgi:hypothetical protein